MLKKGFTLAETIITLGIIGVVVAITTPIVIHSTAKAQVGPKLAKTVAIFEQANAAILQTNNSNSMLAKYYKNNAFDYEKYSAELNNYLKSNITANSVRFVPAAYAVKVRDNTESGTLNYDWSDGASYTYEPEIVKPPNPFGKPPTGFGGGGGTGDISGPFDPCKFDPNGCDCRCKGKTGEAYKSCCCEVHPWLCAPPPPDINYCLKPESMLLPECQCENASNYQECICEKAPLTDGCGYNICNYLIPGTPQWESQCAELNLYIDDEEKEFQQIDFCRLNPHGRVCKCQTLSVYSEEYRDLGCGGTSNEQSGRPSSPPEEKLDPIELPTNWAGLFVKDKSITLNNGISIAYEIKKVYIDAPSELASRKQRIGVVAIDINGIKNGKNEIAKDIFAFVMYNDGSLRPVGIYNWDGTQNDDLVWKKECNIGSEGGNPYCTGAIFENKFKVKYKY